MGQNWLRDGTSQKWFDKKDLKSKTFVQERKRKERIFNVAMNVYDYTTIVEYLDAMATASKK